ncbi:unnamed protein product [Lactuca saligna]|uniref:Uncharacterized protein n=1 Tax=Lactuca saligna TaxID=75948 RepID=A0AA35VIU6_LACSI|nr:unnamed protein product [Lactuca saligna]
MLPTNITHFTYCSRFTLSHEPSLTLDLKWHICKLHYPNLVSKFTQKLENVFERTCRTQLVSKLSPSHEENHSNGVTNEDMAINLLQTQLELSLIREDFQDQLREFRQAVNRDLDAINREVNDVRAGQMDISNLVAGL